MNEPKPVSLYWLLAGAFILSTIVFDWSYADEGPHHHDDNGDVTIDTTLTGGDNIATNTASNSIAGSRSYGVSQSLGDVDQCYNGQTVT